MGLLPPMLDLHVYFEERLERVRCRRLDRRVLHHWNAARHLSLVPTELSARSQPAHWMYGPALRIERTDRAALVLDVCPS